MVKKNVCSGGEFRILYETKAPTWAEALNLTWVDCRIVRAISGGGILRPSGEKGLFCLLCEPHPIHDDLFYQ